VITVVIPTRGRPAMLRQALRSVRMQTALARVSLVLVSENGGSRDSESVAREFDDLPLKYVWRAQPMASFEHFLALTSELPDATWTAMLHDDDWWGPTHLEDAFAALAAVPEAGAYFANHFAVESESAPLGINPYSACWYAAGFPRLDEIWKMDRLAMAVACLAVTPSHYSALVTRTAHFRQCAWVHSLRNPFDGDRLMMFALSRFGITLYNCMPRVFVRLHSGQDWRSFTWSEQVACMSSTTERVISDSAGLGIEGALLQTYERCPESFREPLYTHYFSLPWCAPVLRRHGLPLPQPGPIGWKTHARRWMPPAMLQTWGRLRRNLRMRS
jgi:hypothetical protein